MPDIQPTTPVHQGLVPSSMGGGLTQRDTANAVTSALTASAVAEVRMAIELAWNHPRNEDDARSRMLRLGLRYRFAEKALYSYPRGGSIIMGPSIKLAEELGKVWGNLRWGAYVIEDLERQRTVRGWAWDLEANTKKEIDLTFEKLVYRKPKGGQGGGWQVPDERDLLELTNKNGSKAVRNALLGLLPWDLVEDAKELCLETLKNEDKKDPDRTRKAMLMKYAELGISGAELTAFLGFPLEQMGPKHVEELRGVYTALRDGEYTWQDAVAKKAGQEGVQGHAAPKTMTELRKRVAEKAQQASQEQARGAT